MSRAHRTAALLVMLAFLAFSTFGAGWVVCAGADGHVAIESLAAGCCGDEGAAPGDHDDRRDCGDCDDTLLAQVSPVREADPDVPDVAPASAAAPVVPLPCAWTCAERDLVAVPRAPPRPPPAAHHPRTTVLRL